ncbi:MAG: YdeI/OmpD-associated family protein [Catenulispora sp.]
MDVLEFADGAAWEEWLEQHHDTALEVWLRIGKRHADVALLSIDEARDGALAYGWIDGHRRGLDGVSFLQRYSPRRTRSPWALRTADRAEEWSAPGRMRSPGLVVIEAPEDRRDR